MAEPRLGRLLQAMTKGYDAVRQLEVRNPGLLHRAAGLNETIGNEGGFLVGEELAGELIDRMYQTGEIISRCRELPIGPTGANELDFPKYAEGSRAEGSRLGGVRAYWGAEASTITATKPTFARGKLELKRLTALCYVTNELLADAGLLENAISQAFAEEMSFQLENAIVNGIGGDRPLGILKAPALITVAKEGGQTAGTITTQNVLDAEARLWPSSQRSAVWIVNQEAKKKLFPLMRPVSSGQVPLYETAKEPGGSPMMCSFPVIPVEYCPVAGTVGDLILADFTRYAIARRTLAVDFSMDVKFVEDESAFRFRLRVDGQPIDAGPVTPLNGTDTLSPFVAIADRA